MSLTITKLLTLFSGYESITTKYYNNPSDKRFQRISNMLPKYLIEKKGKSLSLYLLLKYIRSYSNRVNPKTHKFLFTNFLSRFFPAITPALVCMSEKGDKLRGTEWNIAKWMLARLIYV